MENMYITKKRDLNDKRGRAVYLILDENKNQTGQLTCNEVQIKAYAQNHSLSFIDYKKDFLII